MSLSGPCRHLSRLLSDLAAEHGEVEVVHERHDCPPEVRDAHRDRYGAFGRAGGVGAWIRDDDGARLLVRREGGWAEPGGVPRRDESRADCARRLVREQAGLDPAVTGLSHVHVRHLGDWTERDPVPAPLVVFEGVAGGDPEPGDDVRDAAWHEDLPEDLLYEGLRDLAQR